MTDERRLLKEVTADVAQRHLARRASGKGSVPESSDVWLTLEAAGLTTIGIPEALGGSGGELGDLVVVVRELARNGLDAPLAETALLGGWLACRTQSQLAEGPLTVALGGRAESRDGAWTVTADIPRAAWGQSGKMLLLLVSTEEGAAVAVMERAAVTVVADGDAAIQPRDGVRVVGQADSLTVLNGESDVVSFRARGALGRAASMVGAMDSVLSMSVTYAAERHQFGKPLHAFQAVQHHLAVMAAECAAADASLTAAVHADGVWPEEDSWIPTALAKIRVGSAAGVVSRTGHQVHGAIGFTREHPLHTRTQRLWAWRDDYGSEAEWSREVGRRVLEAGAENLWPLLTRT